MLVKVICMVLLTLLPHLGQRGLVEAEGTRPMADSRRPAGDASKVKQEQAILSWVHVVLEGLEEQLTHTFWAWWQEDAAQDASTGGEPALDKLARLKETQTILYWLQTHLGHLEAARLQTLDAWAQEGRRHLDEQQFQTLRAWWLEGADAAAAAAEQALADIARDKNQPLLPAVLPEDKAHNSAFASSTASLSLGCAEHLQETGLQAPGESLTQTAWLHHVSECETCCAPILNAIMDEHVAHVAQQPHTVVLFDFDTFHLKPRSRQWIDALMESYEQSQGRILLIARASAIGPRGYNIELSGKRAGEIRDYLVASFGVDDDRLQYLYFGYDPPQLTLAHAERYGITDGDLASIDTAMKNTSTARLNQSVVVVLLPDAP